MLLSRGFEVTRVTRRSHDVVTYSDVEPQVAQLLGTLNVSSRQCVDIGAADGKQGSNTYSLFRDGWSGLAIEPSETMFERLAVNYAPMPRVQLFRGFVTPDNVVDLLSAANIARSFGFLSLDIDGYDHDVLSALLSEFRPALICVEVNEKIPPPVRFAVRYSPDFHFRAGLCYGHSLATLADLLEAKTYVLLDLCYNNALAVPVESGLPGVSVEEAYDRGYRSKRDRLDKMPWNRSFEPLLEMTPADVVTFVNNQPDCKRNRDHYDIAPGT